MKGHEGCLSCVVQKMKLSSTQKKYESKKVEESHITHSKAVPMTCAPTVLIDFVSTQNFRGFMSQNYSYLLLTQPTVEKRTNGTNVGLQSPAFYFSSLGPV